MAEIPGADKVIALAEEHGSNFIMAPREQFPRFGYAGGTNFPPDAMLGITASYSEEIIEEIPGEMKKVLRTYSSEVGDFTAITVHPAANPDDMHWEKKFIATLEDLERLACAKREAVAWDAEAFRRTDKSIGEAGMPYVDLFHPLGSLARSSSLEEVYIWIMTEPELLHKYLEPANIQVAESIKAMTAAYGPGLVLYTWAYEMLIPPWMGMAAFDEFVLPYDKAACAPARRGGAKIRAHSHGNIMDYLARLAEIGIDNIEPLEPLPMGNVDLAEAKRMHGDKMLLTGNLTSEHFNAMSKDQVREQVKNAIKSAAKGGGFTLACSGGAFAGTNNVSIFSRDEKINLIKSCGAMIEAGLEFGQYPIKF